MKTRTKHYCVNTPEKTECDKQCESCKAFQKEYVSLLKSYLNEK